MGQLVYNAARSRKDALKSVAATIEELTKAIVHGDNAKGMRPEYDPTDLVNIRATLSAFLHNARSR